MTREEAIELLNQYNLYSPTKQIEEAIDMAIEALSAEQTEYKLPGHDEVMEKLDKLTLKGGGNNV